MKILKIFGIVAGIHAVALLLIFANPGCSSSSAAKAPAPPETAAQPAPAAPAPVITAPVAAPDQAPVAAPAAEPAPSGGSVFYAPTRPGNPAASALAAQPVSGVTPATTYTVTHGDSLWSVAKKNHLKVSELAAANNLRPGATLQLGQKLLIPSKPLPEEGPAEMSAPASAPARAAAAPAKPDAAGATKHVVQRGETLGSIARKYGVRASDLGAANAISDPKKIHPGMELVIPAGGRAPAARAPGSSSAKPAPAAAAPAPIVPTINVGPPAPADLNAGLKPANDAEVPVIKVESQPAAATPTNSQ